MTKIKKDWNNSPARSPAAAGRAKRQKKIKIIVMRKLGLMQIFSLFGRGNRRKIAHKSLGTVAKQF
jgi:hypothetical protein